MVLEQWHVYCIHAGGKPHDEVGEAIVNLSDQLAKLKEVTKFARRFSQVQEQAADVLPLVDNKVADIKKTIHKLTTASGYADFKENYKASETVEPTIEALEELKGKFTVTKFDEKIGEVLPYYNLLVDEAKQEQDNPTKAIADRIMAKIRAGDEIAMMQTQHSKNMILKKLVHSQTKMQKLPTDFQTWRLKSKMTK